MSRADPNLPYGPDLDRCAAEADALMEGVSRLDAAVAKRFTFHHRRYRGMTGQQVLAAGPTLGDARDVVASQEAFTDWASLERFADGLRQEANSPSALFERAARLVVDGRADELRALLKRSPKLAGVRSPRRHGGSLWHYLAANGVEDSMQRVTASAVDVADALTQAGVPVDEPCNVYGGGPGSTPLVALVSSCHPADAGVQVPLVKAFVRAGANPEGIDNDGLPLRVALGFRYPAAANALAESGARPRDLPSAAGVGDVGAVVEFLSPESGRVSQACEFPNPTHDPLPAGVAPLPPEVMRQALVFAAMAGEVALVDRFLSLGVLPNGGPRRDIGPLHEAAFQGHREVVDRMIAGGGDPTRRDSMWDSTAIGWADGGGRRELIDHLFAVGPVDIRDAVELQRPDVVGRLLAADPSLADGPDGDGCLLRTAAFHGDSASVRVLLAAGAQRELRGELGVTAAEYARRGGHDAVAALLRGGDTAPA